MFEDIGAFLAAIFEALKEYLRELKLDSVFDLLIGLVRGKEN